jgi:hypothetical protein
MAYDADCIGYHESLQTQEGSLNKNKQGKD